MNQERDQIEEMFDRAEQRVMQALAKEQAAETIIRREAARRIAEMAMERCRELNGDASELTRAGQNHLAAIEEIKADCFVWMSNAIEKEFGLV